MRCIFCKGDSGTSKTIEHIVPESLGNREHILRAGVVCDKCNSYFGVSIEKPLLGSDYFRQARFRNLIHNKSNRIPSIQGALLPGIIPIEMEVNEEGKIISPVREKDLKKLKDTIININEGKLIFPVSERPDEGLMSRFLAKLAIEVLASRFLDIPNGLNEVINKSELDELRHYARFGAPPKYWPYHSRVIYPEKKMFVEGTQKYEMLHEYTLLYTDLTELYLVVAIFGIEYAINMGGPIIDGYMEWLKEHNFKSPLYMDDISSLE